MALYSVLERGAFVEFPNAPGGFQLFLVPTRPVAEIKPAVFSILRHCP
jgi:hypothetical protein